MDAPQFEFIQGVQFPLIRGESHECPYFKDRQATELYLASRWIDSSVYQNLMDNGFRRSGQIFYKPVCKSCQACESIRVKVSDFKASKSQRRAFNKNQDIEISIHPLAIDAEKHDLYSRYQEGQHEGGMACTMDEYEDMFCYSTVEGMEMQYRLNQKLVGVGVLDVATLCLSSVYFYFDPDYAKRSLGVFSALMEIEQCKKMNRPYWYSGFYIKDCQKMEYKNQYRPYELLDANGVWQAPHDSLKSMD